MTKRSSFVTILLIAIISLPAAMMIKYLIDRNETENMKSCVVQMESDCGEGTGFIISKKNNILYILTASHVISSSENICLDQNPRVRLYGVEENFPASLVSIDSGIDVALLRLNLDKNIQARKISTIEIDSDVILKDNDEITVIGVPGAIDGLWHVERNCRFVRYKTDIVFSGGTITPGMSGSPIFREKSVVGMLTNTKHFHIGVSAENIIKFLMRTPDIGKTFQQPMISDAKLNDLKIEIKMKNPREMYKSYEREKIEISGFLSFLYKDSYLKNVGNFLELNNLQLLPIVKDENKRVFLIKQELRTNSNGNFYGEIIIQEEGAYSINVGLFTKDQGINPGDIISNEPNCVWMCEPISLNIVRKRKKSSVGEELKEKGLLKEVCEANDFFSVGNPTNINKAREIYNDILLQLSDESIAQLDQQLYLAASSDIENHHFDEAAQKYYFLFEDIHNTYCAGVIPMSTGITIYRPMEGESVGRTGIVKGSAKLKSGEHLWVLVHCNKGFHGMWWPQGEAIVDPRDNEWKLTVHYGISADIGYEFEIAVIIVENVVNLKLHNFLKLSMQTGDFKPVPMPELNSPPEIVTVMKITH